MSNALDRVIISVPKDGDPARTVYGFACSTEVKKIELSGDLRWQPAGLTSAALKASIKYEGIYDMAIVKMKNPGPAAGVFTRSRSAGAAVHIDRHHLQDGVAQALVVVSKNANVFTPTDRRDAEDICRLVADAVDVRPEDVIISCTGVIGVPLPMDKIAVAISRASGTLSPGLADEVPLAILTTDRGPKVCSVAFGEGRLAAMAKGAGMIEPNLATMLAYFFTNINISPERLRSILADLSERTFNSISVDSDTSTSDSVVVFSTGEVEATEGLVADFEAALAACMTKLSRDIVYQAEGATKLVEARVTGAADDRHAKKVAKLIINSPLVKTAIFGADPNWGRVVMAIGKPTQDIEQPINHRFLTISINGLTVFNGGVAVPIDLDALSDEMRISKRVCIEVALGDGIGQWVAWGCDLTDEYVKINAEYTS